jgi:hypothetical protein
LKTNIVKVHVPYARRKRVTINTPLSSKGEYYGDKIVDLLGDNLKEFEKTGIRYSEKAGNTESPFSNHWLNIALGIRSRWVNSRDGDDSKFKFMTSLFLLENPEVQGIVEGNFDPSQAMSKEDFVSSLNLESNDKYYLLDRFQKAVKTYRQYHANRN